MLSKASTPGDTAQLRQVMNPVVIAADTNTVA